MGIEIVPYAPEHVDRVVALNQRLRAGGFRVGWYESCEDAWLPRRPDVPVWREHYVAVENGAEIRGAYALKPQPWWIKDRFVTVTDWQGPVSEGIVDARYAPLGLRFFRDMQKRQPLLYSWGHGGEEARMLQLLRSMKWHFHSTPFCLRVARPFPFLRESTYLRSTRGRRLALDLLAWSGLGWLGLRSLFGALSLRGAVAGRPARRLLDVTTFDEFGPWADALWEECVGAYQAIGLRDARTMNALLPRSGWPPGIRLRVREGERTLGWVVVMDNALRDDPRFGRMRVGSVIDCRARPEDAPAVIRAATDFLLDRGVDMIGSNQAHPEWVRAFEANGFLSLPNRRYFAISPALFEALSPLESVGRGLHLTNLDGHGPHGL
jgi:hypothetical protein